MRSKSLTDKFFIRFAAAMFVVSSFSLANLTSFASEKASAEAKQNQQSAKKDINKALKAYTDISDALASDELSDVKVAAEKAQKLFKKASSGAADVAAAIGASDDLEAARNEFQTLSSRVVDLLSKYPELQESYQVFTCPMVKGFNKWVQTSETGINNPYMGKRMLKCGSKV